ncbi:ketoacyl-ACP synthase III [Spirochaeta isovalerica]|uniref:3-oxoacyl-[acyl-carrier-protein] synthase-3 n=1 Tax=Spirochaeta isovalerica TaxID=150 RepID=A0A841RG23_9SPIO|nr:ketoacyl-ACP synthase III [Spirochaeta isovalerica]MBB6482536.1 3-oxoacyl-[acyl-carrier-protein] synthase-3 [Spirochaeta isovalerica]
MASINIKGVGIYAPGEPIDNHELMELTGIEIDPEKMENKLGIVNRHIAHLRGMDETTADFAEKAALAAIADAQIDPEDIGLFIAATDTPEYISPATGVLLQGRIQKGERYSCAFDIASSCASFTTALDVAANMLSGRPDIKYALVTGIYNMPAFVRPGDAFGYSIFADGAGAFILERTEEQKYLAGFQLADGTQWDFIGVYTGGTRIPFTKEKLEAGQYGLEMWQRLPGDRNVNLWPKVVRKALEKAGLEKADHYFFTQINRAVIHEVMDILVEPYEKTTTVMDKYGYTGSACIPMAFFHAVKEGRIKRGDRIVTIASGAGLAVGCNVFIY